LDITTIHRSGFLSAQIRITLNDLECPIQRKVRFTDGTLGVRLLRVLDSTVRIGVARGGGGVDWVTGLFVPKTFRSQERNTNFGRFVPWTIRSLDVSFQGRFVPLSIVR